MNVEAIIFDFDGVVVSSEPIHHKALLKTCQAHGIDFPETMEAYERVYIGYDDRDALRVAQGYPAGKRAEPVIEKRIEDLCTYKQQVFDNLLTEGELAVPGAIAMIDSCLVAGMPIAIGSGATQQDIKACLQLLNRCHAFEIIVAADDVTYSKPHPETYQLVLARLSAHIGRDLNPANCIVIEDTTTGLASARAAGIPTFALPTSLPEHALQGHATKIWPTAQHPSLAELLSCFQSV